MMLFGSYSILAVSSFYSSDPSFNTATENAPQNLMGETGAIVADVILQYFGLPGYLFLIALCLTGFRLIKLQTITHSKIRAALMILSMVTLSIAIAIFATAEESFKTGAAGVAAIPFIKDFIETFNVNDAVIAGVACAMSLIFAISALNISSNSVISFGKICIDIITLKPVTSLIKKIISYLPAIEISTEKREKPNKGNKPINSKHLDLRNEEFDDDDYADAKDINKKKEEEKEKEYAAEDIFYDEDEKHNPTNFEDTAYEDKDDAVYKDKFNDDEDDQIAAAEAEAFKRRKKIKIQKQAASSKPSNIKTTARKAKGDFKLPPIDLLEKPKKSASRLSDIALKHNAMRLEGVLQEFGIKGKIVKVCPGPVVTLYELEPAPGIKTARVIGLADDIARAMSAVSVRIAVVRGRSVIGIELPNEKSETVFLRELIAGKEFHSSSQKLGLALGQDIGGAPECVDLARMPHLLIAGTTGSGKSVAINTMLLSLLYRHTPDECRFIMIDPKMLELSVYNDIPHLLTPVVTDPGKAVVALKWAVREMEDRYRAMSQLNVRNLDGYNKKLSEASKKGKRIIRTVQTGFDPETGQPIMEDQEIDLTPLPYIVVIVDEMADLMLVAGKDVEAAIQRLAQMARAAGIHLIMATQRPSVDVITGTIKANFPTRISFQVTSKIDSRTILGEQGAEQLLGKGDMLYMASGQRPARVHGPFVSDTEVEDVVNFLKEQSEPEYISSVTEDVDGDGGLMGAGGASGGSNGGGDEYDALYDEAVAIVTRERKASTSFVQRKLRIGYNRAASIIEVMEEQGVISSANHAGKREVLAPEPPDF
ncbi:MAG: cell division protein FtsK [Alphaproteobacteria bacterium]|nr:cell division protein FtsK [Alphaproteobacteria bacterium]